MKELPKGGFVGKAAKAGQAIASLNIPLRAGYGARLVLDGVDLALRPGEKAEPAADAGVAQPETVLLPPENGPESGRRVQVQ
mgnify:CR=1 FL=1